MLIGHQRQKEYFLNALKNENLSQGYIFVGQGNVGKFSLARKLAYAILFLDKKEDLKDFCLEKKITEVEIQKMKLCSGYLEISGDEEIRVENIKNIKDKIIHTSIAGNKAVVIKKIERMSAEAGNALLKILEEPRGNTIFIFTAENSGSVMSTIFSRLIPVYFNPLAREEIKKFVLNFLKDEELAEVLSKISNGQPGKVIDFAQNLQNFENFKNNIDKLKNYLESPIWKRVLNSSQDSFDLQNLLMDWLRFLDYALPTSMSYKDFFTDKDYWKNLGINKLKNCLEKVHSVYLISQNTNVNKRLILEELVLSL